MVLPNRFILLEPLFSIWLHHWKQIDSLHHNHYNWSETEISIF